MTKARRAMERDVKLVDIVIELLDARAPISTENPDIKKITRGKKRLVLLNKADLADKNVTTAWIKSFKNDGCEVVALDSRSNNNLGMVRSAMERLAEEKYKRDREKGIKERPVRALICGIPNVGKSTFINSLCGKASAKTGDKPGVTKGNQWLRVNTRFELLDTPGVLWPKFDDERIGTNLALIGAVNDQIINKEELVIELIDYLIKNYSGVLEERYALSEDEIKNLISEYEGRLMALGVNKEALAYLEVIAKKRGCIKREAEADFERAAKLITDDFKNGRLGRISLEKA